MRALALTNCDPFDGGARRYPRARGRHRPHRLWCALALLLAAGACFAAETPPAVGSDSDVEAKLAAARARLDKAAREVAELSMQLGEIGRDSAVQIRSDLGRGVVGLQLDPASGKEGARVMEVSPGGPASEAGIRAGDVILAVNGNAINGDHTARQVVERMRAIAPDARVKLRVLRAGKTQEFDVVARPALGVVIGGALGAVPVPPPGVLPRVAPFENFQYFHAFRDEIAGMELATLTPVLGQYFGTEKGVLVIRAPDSSAFRLQDGDVILAIDGREPKNGSHATRILRSYQPGEKIELKIMRQKKPLSLVVTMPDPSSDDRPVRLRREDEGRA